jgi:hypothetical protein
MKIDKNWIIYAFPTKLFILAAVFHSPAFAYASCLALALGFGKEYLDKKSATFEAKSGDASLRHKVEQLEAALSAMVNREKARGW